MDYQRTNPDCDCDQASVTRDPNVDPQMRSASDRYFTSYRAEGYKCVRPTERDILAVPWGPRIDVLFDPKSAPGSVGGRVRVMARTGSTEIEIASAPIISDAQPIALTASGGCDEYVVKAVLGSDPGASARRVDSYVYARIYTGR